MRAVPALLLCLPLLAQGPPITRRAPVLEAGPSGSALPQLWVRNLTLPPAWALGDPELAEAWDSDIREGDPTKAQQAALWDAEGWTAAEPRVVLVNEVGRKLASWAALPKPAEVREALRASGWAPRRERLEAFLREHPDHGQARVAQVGLLLLRLLRLDPEAPSETEAAAFLEALGTLRQDPAWVDHAPLFFWGSLLGILARRPHPPLPPDLSRSLREEVAQTLRASPYDAPLWFAWGSLVSDGSQVDALVAQMIGLPGDPPLPSQSVFPLMSTLVRLGDGPRLEAIAERMLGARPPLPDRDQARWQSGRIAAHFLQGRKAEGFRQLQADLEAHPEPALWLSILMNLPDGPSPLTSEDRQRIAELQRTRPRNRPPVPAAEPAPGLRLDLGGSPPWSKAAAALAGDPAFDDWGGSELAWGTLDSAAWAALRARNEWGPDGRWVLHRGEDLIASGTELPSAAALADRVREAGLPELAQLRQLLKEHPGYLAARRRRMRLVQVRMPHPRLEVMLLEDARVLGEAFLVPAELGEKLQKPLWEAASRRVLPELEGLLHRWPGDEMAWTAWLDWTALAGTGDAAALLARLDLFPTRPEEEGPLPYRLASALGARLKAQGRWAELAAWGRPFWSHLALQLPVALDRARGARRDAPPEGADRSQGASVREASERLQEMQALLRLWAEALRATRAQAEAEAVAQALEALQPGLALRVLGSPEKAAKAPSRPAPPMP